MAYLSVVTDKVHPFMTTMYSSSADRLWDVVKQENHSMDVQPANPQLCDAVMSIRTKIKGMVESM